MSPVIIEAMSNRILIGLLLCTLASCATTQTAAPTSAPEDDDLAPEGMTAGMKDEKSAEEICAGGAGDMCSALADHTFRKAKTAEDWKKGLNWALSGCSRRDAAGCSLAGWAYEWGKAGPVDLTRAVRTYEVGCQAGDARGCVKAAAIWAFGPVALRNRVRANGLTEKGCGELKDPELCALDAKLKAEPKGSESNHCGKNAGEGTLSKQDIGQVIKWHAPEVKDCFDRALQAEPKLSGRVEVAWVIDCAGAVTKPTVAESTLPPRVAECVLSNVKQWKFPAPQGGGTLNISFPWVLKPTAATK